MGWVVSRPRPPVSGKSVSDHAISAVAQKDCATWRLIKGDPICVDYPSEEPPVMLADVPRDPKIDQIAVALRQALEPHLGGVSHRGLDLGHSHPVDLHGPSSSWIERDECN